MEDGSFGMIYGEVIGFGPLNGLVGRVRDYREPDKLIISFDGLFNGAPFILSRSWVKIKREKGSN